VALPLVIDEEQIFSFKFWFDGTIHQGMYYQNELYCRLQTFQINQRSQVYQLGCKLAAKDILVALTCTETTCSLWGSLRADDIKNILSRKKLNLPASAPSASTPPASIESPPPNAQVSR
jgi:hypothetical protein